MARRGQCRCGLILTFHRTAQGYKMRCPSCGSVVRLRAKKKKRRAPRPPEKTVLQPAAGDLPPSDEIDVELVSLSELAGGTPSPPRRSKRWLVVVGIGAALLLVGAGMVWWMW